jgi:alginate O-acetyltransferase complex protein AlgI
MLFNSWIFLLFICAFMPVFVMLRKHVLPRNLWILIASYVFYGWWDARFLILVAVSTSVDYVAALGAAGKPVKAIEKIKSLGFLTAVMAVAMAISSKAEFWIVQATLLAVAGLAICYVLIDRRPVQQQRKAWLFLSLIVNLGILGFFKYANFFAASLADLATLVGVDVGYVTLNIILPVGLSFYTFQAIGRTIDAYRGDFDPGRSLINYAAYHAFFPQLVAGPIERASALMPQFERVLPITMAAVKAGALLFLWGLFKKLIIADNLADVSDAFFNAPGGQSSMLALAGILAFTIQIYCDFSGYSDMARGVARLLGFELVHNFRLPYFARSPSEFWQRWHVSLSGWLRDYLYIPLGGNRGGLSMTYRNLMLTMVLGGLWHGAAWTFVIWGAIHGAILIGFRAVSFDALIARVDGQTARGFAVHLAGWAATMTSVVCAWVFFRARTLGDAFAAFSSLTSFNGATAGTEQLITVFMFSLPLILVEIYQRMSGHIEFLSHGPFLVRYTVVVSLVLALVLLTPVGGRQFIYFDF